MGGLLGSLVAWRLGVLLGPPAISDSAAGLANQARFDGPLEISAMGVLLAWSTAAVVTFFAAVAGLDAREPHEPAPATATSDVLPESAALVPARSARAAGQPGQVPRPTGAVVAPVTDTRSSGDSETCRPRRPAET